MELNWKNLSVETTSIKYSDTVGTNIDGKSFAAEQCIYKYERVFQESQRTKCRRSTHCDKFFLPLSLSVSGMQLRKHGGLVGFPIATRKLLLTASSC